MSVLFIAVPRTGTGSMHSAIAHNLAFTHPNGRNIPASKLREYVGEKVWNNSFKFAFVREPYDRFVSAVATMLDVNTFEEAFIYNPTITMPQVDFIDEELDFIGKYETIDRDWDRMRKKAGWGPAPLPHVNRRPFETPTWVDRDQVIEYYKKDYERFYPKVLIHR